MSTIFTYYNLRKLSFFKSLFQICCCIFLISVGVSSYAQQGCTCDDAPVAYGPAICGAKLYCSNNTKISDGVIACTTAADTDGCGVDVSVPGTIGFNSRTLFQTTMGACYDQAVDLNVQWIKFYSPVGINTIKLQGVGSSLTAWAVYHKVNNTEFVDENDPNTPGQCPTGDYTGELASELAFVGCSRVNQWKILTDDTFVPGELNLYYIALLYSRTSQGTVNFKTKECDFVCPEIDITCADDKVEQACQTQEDINDKFDAFLNQFSYTGGTNVVTSIEYSSDNENFGPTPIVPDACGDVVYVRYSVQDDCDTDFSCDASFTVNGDNEKPTVVSCPSGGDLGCNPEPSEYAAGSANWSDNCGIDDSGVNSGQVEIDGCSASIIHTYWAEDACGNREECTETFTWTIDDEKPTTDDCPQGGAIGCSPEPVDYAPGNVTWSDNCGIADSGVIEGEVGVDGCSAEVTHTYWAIDGCGNRAECIQTFTWSTDTAGPVLESCPEGGEIECNAEGPSYAPAEASWSDACGLGETGVTPGEVIIDGCSASLTNIYWAEDLCGNREECTQTFTWTVDEGAPTIVSCPEGGELGCNPNSSEYAPGTATWDDNCGIADSGVTPGEVEIEGCSASITHTYWAVDECNNREECTQTFTWTVDEENPSIICPTDTEACGLGELPNAYTSYADFVSAGGSASDNCGINESSFTLIDESSSGTCPSTVSRTYRIADNCGNTSTCTQEFEVYEETVENCETLFGYNGSRSQCFLTDGFERWGWYAPLSPGETVVFDLYIGNGGGANNDCNPTDGPGTYVGTATAIYSGNTVTVEYDLIAGKILTEYHINLGCSPYPTLRNGKTTVAPGSYTAGGIFENGVENFTVTFTNVSGATYIIIHGVACDIACECGSESIFDDVSGTSYNSPINCVAPTSALSVSPNPFLNTVKVSYNFPYNTSINIDVIDLKGVKFKSLTNINTKAGVAGSKDIDLTKALDQIYFVRVVTSKEVIVKQIVKQ